MTNRELRRWAQTQARDVGNAILDRGETIVLDILNYRRQTPCEHAVFHAVMAQGMPKWWQFIGRRYHARKAKRFHAKCKASKKYAKCKHMAAMRDIESVIEDAERGVA